MGNSRSKKEEETLKKIFNQGQESQDEFTVWCTTVLSGLNSSLDIPTFVGFLKDVESPYEVTDYVRSYLGDSKAAKDFTKQFIEKRSRWKQMMKESKTSGRKPKMSEQQNLSLSPSNVDKKSTEFTVVKTKGAKGKKKKMQKVDVSNLLGFT